MVTMKSRVIYLVLAGHLLFAAVGALANSYLAKPGEAPLVARVGTCSITGGFIHFYSALFNGLFDKYGLKDRTRDFARRRCQSRRVVGGRDSIHLLLRRSDDPAHGRRRRRQADRLDYRRTSLGADGAQRDQAAAGSQGQKHRALASRRPHRSAGKVGDEKIQLDHPGREAHCTSAAQASSNLTTPWCRDSRRRPF